MIAYDVNDAPRQQLFPSERARAGLRVLTVARFAAANRFGRSRGTSTCTYSLVNRSVMGFDRLSGQVQGNLHLYLLSPLISPEKGGREGAVPIERSRLVSKFACWHFDERTDIVTIFYIYIDQI